MTTLRLSKRIDAPRDTVWSAVTHHEGMPTWSPLKSVTLSKEGAPDRDGVGAVRVMRGPGMRIDEEVVGWDPPNAYDYTLLRGAPIRDHRGRVELRDAGGATDVEWTIEFRPLIPGTGWLIRAALGRAIGGMLRRLKRNLEAEK